MSNVSAVLGARSELALVLGAAIFLGSGSAISGTKVSTVQTWPARPGATLSSDDVLKLTEIGGVSVQPHGRLVSFTTMSADPACNCYHVKLNVLDRRTRHARVIADLGQPFRASMPDGSINGEACVAEALWSRDGRYLAYIVNRMGHGVLSVYGRGTKRSRSVDLGGDEVFGFTWDDSGDRIIYQTGGPRPTSIRQLQRGEREGYLYGPEFAADPERLPVIARVPEAHAFKIDDEDAISAPDRAWSDLRVIDVETGARREASPAELEFAKTSEFSYSQEPMQDATKIWSSDRRFVISLGKPEIAYSGRPVTIRRRDGAAEIRRTSAEICPGRNRMRDVALAYWNSAANRFVVICSRLSSGWAVGAPGDVVSLSPLDGSARSMFSIAATNANGSLGRQCDVAAGVMICVREQPSEPPALYEFSLGDGASVALYDPNAGLRRRQFPRIDRLVWDNSYGLPTRADLVYPYGYADHHRYPLVITQYSDGGFLRGNTGDENPVFAYARGGFFVLNFAQTAPVVDRPGLSFLGRMKRMDRGHRWQKSIQDSLDIVIRDLVDRGLVDPSRVAYTGLSGGSNQIDYALANGRRIAAVITSTCCISPEYWVTNPLSPDFYELIDVENPVTDKNRSKWSTISPELHVGEIHTAILANVAEDERFSFEPLWILMRYAHKPMETYVYAGEYHVKFQPAHLAAIQHRNVEWLRFWLQGYEDSDPEKAQQYVRWRRLRDDWCRHDPKCVAIRSGEK